MPFSCASITLTGCGWGRCRVEAPPPAGQDESGPGGDPEERNFPIPGLSGRSSGIQHEYCKQISE
jgi:hypothetical protein